MIRLKHVLSFWKFLSLEKARKISILGQVSTPAPLHLMSVVNNLNQEFADTEAEFRYFGR